MKRNLNKIYNNIRRELATALSFTCLLALLIIPVNAETSNDLRRLLEIPENSYTISGEIEYNINPSEEESEKSTEFNQKIIEERTSSADVNKNDEHIEEINNLELIVSNRIDGNYTAYLIVISIEDLINTIDKYKNDDKELANDYVSRNTVIIEENTDINKGNTDITSINDDEVYTKEILETSGYNEFEQGEIGSIYSLQFNIGAIGNYAICPVKNYFMLVTPYGYTKYPDEETYTHSKLLGIDLYAKEGDDIVSQWNGVIISIKNDETNIGKSIQIYHGNSTYTIYNHVEPINDIKVGKSVKQGQLIATVVDTEIYETEKDNHMFYQITLNGKYINPLLIYGTRAKSIYERWLTTYPLDNVVEAGEKYYNDNNMDYSPGIGMDVPEVLYPDFNKEN